jgi:hypothetical protein
MALMHCNSYASSAFPALYDAITQADNIKAQYLEERLALIIDGAAELLNGQL